MHGNKHYPDNASDDIRYSFNPARIDAIVQAAVHKTLESLERQPAPVPTYGLRPPACARFIGIDLATLQDWRSRGIGPRYRKIGNRVVYPLPELYQFMERHPLYGSGALAPDTTSARASNANAVLAKTHH